MVNIIACDDDIDIVRALKIYLSAEGFNVLEAYNGNEVLRLLAENEVHQIGRASCRERVCLYV